MPTTPSSSEQDRGLMRVEEVARYLGIGRSKTYQLLGVPGGIPVIRIGKCVRVQRQAVDRWIAAQMGGSAESATD